MGFPVFGGEDYGAYAIRPYPFGRKKERPLGFFAPEKNGTQKCTPKPSADTNRKECPFGFLVLGGEDKGAYAIRPYAFDRKKDCPFSFLIPKKNGNQKCTP